MLVSVHLSYILGGLPLEERFHAARTSASTRSSILSPMPRRTGLRAPAVGKAACDKISIGAPTSDYKAGEPGFRVTPGLKARSTRHSNSHRLRECDRCPNVHVFRGSARTRGAPQRSPSKPIAATWLKPMTGCALQA